MTVTHPNLIRSGIADHVVDQLNGGTIEFQATLGGSAIATLTFGSPAFGDAVDGIATAEDITPDTDCNPGTVTKFQVKTSGSAVVFQGDVSTTGNGGDIILSSTGIGEDDTLSISSLTYEAPD
jgi:hypothetical protein